MGFVTALLLFSLWPGECQIRDVVKSGEIDKSLARTTRSLEVLAKTNYSVEFRVGPEGAGTGQIDRDADEFWFVRHGSAKVSLSERHHDVHPGDVVSVPRTRAYQITADAGRFEYVAVRIFPSERRRRIGIGAAPEPHPMPDVAAKAHIDATLASADKNVLLHSAGAVLINHVIYKGAPGPWEVHQTCDDLYFVRMGTARAKLDGTLIGGKEDPPGEIRGIGVAGARDFTIAPGDMVVIPRNTAHFMDPGSSRLGYLLVKVCD
jgi:mannose-6-phosphate isomerase-like protein (cupin superfamily)